MDSFVCNKCKFETLNQDDMFMHKCKILEFSAKEKTRHEKISELLGSSNYLTFSFTSSGALAYTFGEGMTDEQLTYINKILDIITHDTLKNNCEMYPDGH